MVYRSQRKNKKKSSEPLSHTSFKSKSKAREGNHWLDFGSNLSQSISHAGFCHLRSSGSFLLCIESGLSRLSTILLANVFCRFFVARQNTTRSASPSLQRKYDYFVIRIHTNCRTLSMICNLQHFKLSSLSSVHPFILLFSL